MDSPTVTHSFKATTIEDFMKINDELPETLKQEVQDILARYRLDLEGLDKEIKYHEEQINRLKIHRAQVRDNMARYDGVCSPIRRANTDVLCHIFLHCLSTIRNPIMSAKEAPILLTRVCRAWRHIAYSSPSLWARLHIPFLDYDRLSDHGNEYITQSKEKLRLRCRAIEEWLSRSGGTPLSISITCSGVPWAESDPPESNITSELLHILARFSNRWRNIELDTPIKIYAQLGSLISPAHLPILDCLKVSLYFQTPGQRWSDFFDGATQLLQSKSLTKISLSILTQDWEDEWKLSKIILPDSNLTNLRSFHSHSSVPVTEAYRLLRHCPKLEYFMATLTSNYGGHGGQDVVPPTFTQGQIHLPHLRLLCVEDLIQSDIQESIYQYIEAPQLEWLDYTKKGYLGTYIPSTVITDVAPIAILLQKSTSLKKLIIQVDQFQTSQLHRVLQDASSITHLVLGKTSSSLIQAESLGWGPSTEPRWDFGRLFLNEILDEGVVDNLHPASGLLPHLEILEISLNTSIVIRDDTLLKVILRRMEPSSPNKTLKKVTVDFNRASSTVDVPGEVYAHAERIGAEIDLDLRYVHVKGEKVRDPEPLSPYFGIGRDGRSWRFRDIEEEEV